MSEHLTASAMANLAALRELADALSLPVRDSWLLSLCQDGGFPLPTAPTRDHCLDLLMAHFLECDLNLYGAGRILFEEVLALAT